MLDFALILIVCVFGFVTILSVGVQIGLKRQGRW